MTEIIPFRKTPKPQEDALRFLDTFGQRQDSEAYYKLFSSQKPESFAVIVLDEETLQGDLDAVIFDLRYLIKLSLFPVVVVHASYEVLDEINVEHHFDRARLPVSFLASDLNILDELAFIRKRNQKNTLALIHIESEKNIFNEMSQLAHALKSKRILFLKKEGGLINLKTGKRINLINLSSEKEDYLKSDKLSEEHKLFLDQCDTLIQESHHEIYISVVSPANLLKELFTVKGNGTLIQEGSQILTFDSWKEVNVNGLKILLQNVTEKQVQSSFEKKPVDNFYIEEHYKGAALVSTFDGISFLSHFVVGLEARGFGIGDSLWKALTTHHKKLVWRSEPNQFINKWYAKQCDGLFKTSEWIYYWIGLKPEEINKAIECASMQKVDF